MSRGVASLLLYQCPWCWDRVVVPSSDLRGRGLIPLEALFLTSLHCFVCAHTLSSSLDDEPRGRQVALPFPCIHGTFPERFLPDKSCPPVPEITLSQLDSASLVLPGRYR